MLIDGLNPEQRMVAETLEGPVLVLAGAGSGKTRALTYRIANLIQNGVSPYNILALTFTNKAAKEMKERVNNLVNLEKGEVWVSTFHSFCAKVLRRDIDKIGYERSFTIYDDDDQITLLKNIIKEKDLDEKIYPAKMMRGIISDAKNKLLNADDWFAVSDKDFKADKIHDIFHAYEVKLKKSNALDFNDLLFKTIELFDNSTEVKEHYKRRFKYVHVDEYQDTNFAQYSIVKTLTESSDNLCVVGDDDQSIYGWRGADINNILNFEKDYKNVKVIKLERNYRSTSNILNAANTVIANNVGRKEKALWTDLPDGDLISLFSAQDENDEAAWICDRLEQLDINKYEYSNAAILYRTNAQSRVIEDMLMRAGIPYKIYGSSRFYDRKEVRDVLAYLRVIANPSDDVSLRRIINKPKRSIGNATILELVNYANEKEIPLFATLFDIPETLSSRPYKCVKAFADLMLELIDASKEKNLSDFIEFLIDKTGLITQYDDDLSEDAKTRVENIKELMGAINEFESNSENATLQDYLENVSLFTDLDEADLENKKYISLMTLHSVKGLEFDVVFMSGMEENLFPSYRSTNDDTLLEEERRLCYVGITRARKKLFLSFAYQRTLYNQANFNRPSRFLDEIPESLLDSAKIELREKSFPNLQIKTKRDTQATVKASRIKQRKVAFGAPEIIPPKHVKTLNKIPFVQKGFSPSLANNINSNINIFKPGDRVLHKKFGEGDVVETNGVGRDARIIINFAAYGNKEFSLTIAPIVKLNK